MEVKLDQKRLEDAIVSEAVANILGDDDNIYSRIERQVEETLEKAIAKSLNDRVEATLTAVMERALDTEVNPINIWGEREGKPSTIRAALHERAKNFWQETVDREGKQSKYGGVPRYEHALSIITAKEFDAQIKQNIVNIASAIKDAVRSDFYKQVDAKLNEYFKVSSIDDQKRKAEGRAS